MAISIIGKDVYVDQYDCGVDVEFVIKNEDDTPFDLSGYSAQFIVKAKKDDADDGLSILSDLADNVIKVPIDKELSSNPVGKYYYGIRLFKNGDFVNTIIQGNLIIQNNTFESGVEL